MWSAEKAKIARRCGEKHALKRKCTKHVTKKVTCVYEGKNKWFCCTLIGGSPMKKAGKSQKPQLVLRKGNMCTWRPKVMVFDWNGYGVPYEKGWKITKKVTYVYGGEYVPMKGKSNLFWLKLLWGPLRKRLENHGKNNLSLWRGICAHEGERSRFLTKADGGFPYEKGLKIKKKITCLYERGNLPMKGKVKVFTKIDRRSSTKKAGK